MIDFIRPKTKMMNFTNAVVLLLLVNYHPQGILGYTGITGNSPRISFLSLLTKKNLMTINMFDELCRKARCLLDNITAAIRQENLKVICPIHCMFGIKTFPFNVKRMKILHAITI